MQSTGPAWSALARLGEARRGHGLLPEPADGGDQTFANPRLVFDDENSCSR